MQVGAQLLPPTESTLPVRGSVLVEVGQGVDIGDFKVGVDGLGSDLRKGRL
jgi:hypothetical protein